jgi:hypothetical protein
LYNDCIASISKTTPSPETNKFFASSFIVNGKSESENKCRSAANAVDSCDGLVHSGHFDNNTEVMSSIGFSSIAFDDTVNASSEPLWMDEVGNITNGKEEVKDESEEENMNNACFVRMIDENKNEGNVDNSQTDYRDS